ncbi:MAG TPA: dihydroorotase [Oligoflexia bacterium]|nr:dihydroorotase [Oligoflexia bacterium]HMP47541.1 dihydroorotase [Oligoflexia bacterium]
MVNREDSNSFNRILLKGGRIIDSARNLDKVCDLLIEGDKVLSCDLPGTLGKVEGATEIDVTGKIVVPGLVDIHVHLRDPGEEWKETIITGSEAAVAGGFTDIMCMPNTRPVNDSAAVTEYILDRAKDSVCNVHPIGAISIGSKGEAMAPYGELSDAGCVAFSDDGRPVWNSQLMRRALEYCSMLGRVLSVHEEDLSLSDGFSMNESPLSVRMGLKGMPDAAENVMIARDIELSRLTGGRVHFCHVSTARGVQLIRRAKEDGIPVTAEVSPHHLFLNENAVEGYNTQAKMSMPLRSEEDIEALIAGLNEGVIDCIASDHAPHEADSKNIEFDRASFGILGLQTTVPILFQLVNKGKISLERMLQCLGESAWKSFDLEPRTLATGEVANITIIDPIHEFVLSQEFNKSKSFNSPFWGHSFQGAAVYTIVNGKVRYAL